MTRFSPSIAIIAPISGPCVEPDSATRSGHGPRAHEQDDLKQIYGIGPAMEKGLNRMGLFTFRQIAQWNEQDVEKMASELNTFPDGIRHDNWIAGAKEQHFLKYGEEL